MIRYVVSRTTLLVIGFAVVGFLTACAERKVTTSVADQTSAQGPSPQVAPAPTVERRPPALEGTRITESPVTSPPPSPASRPIVSPSPSVAAGPLADVYFDFDQFLIRTDARAVLEADAKLLKADGTQKILIEGHCDERGTHAYNLVLGERRAQAVQRYVQDLGVSASQIQIASYGKERPFCTEHSDDCWQSNRRAHFRRP